jgi:uroporphyrinogen III methyltransferase/synthase
VEFFFRRLFEKGRDVRSLGQVRTATIGPATAKRLRKYGFQSDIIPETYRAESIIEAFENEPMTGKRVLLPRAKEARPILPIEVRKMGAHVDEVPSYQTEQVTDSVDELVHHLETGSVDMVTFTSSSTVKNFKAVLPPERFENLMEGVKVACIGPITADTARELGLPVDVEAQEFTIPGLCDAILNYYT